MTTRTWKGGKGDWYDPSQWSASDGTTSYPLPGDAVTIGSGEVDLVGSEAKNSGRFDDQVVTLGGANGPATLALEDAFVGRFFSVTTAGNATIEAVGLSDYSGSLTASTANTTLTLGSKADANGLAGNLVLANGGTFTVSNGAALDLEGTIALERGFTLAASDFFTNNAAVSLLVGGLDIASGAYTGTGSIAIGTATTAAFEGSVPDTQTVSFAAQGGRLNIASPTDFHASITGFAPGSLIDLTKVAYAQGDVATYDADAHTVTVTNNGTAVATLAHVSAADGTLVAVSDGGNGTYVEYAGTARTRLPYEIGAAAKAEGADIAHTMTVPGTATPITGAGIRIGILSDSFDLVHPGNANSDAANGYLPSKDDGTSAVNVLKEGPTGSEDEGRAMAELVHQIAPGASIDFYTAADGITDFAAGIAALQKDGCNIILDDWAFPGLEPFYQIAGPADVAISNAVAAGVCYFTLATNYGNAYYEHAFNQSSTTLYDGSAVSAMTFSNGTHYQSITLPANTTTRIDLQWDAPLYGANGTTANQPDSIQFKLFDTAGNLVGSSSQRSLNGQGLAESELLVTTGATATNYQLAIYDADGATVSQIKYILFGRPSGAQTPGGTINDPDAGSGSGLISGHALVPGAITVGATFAGNSPAFGQTADFPDSFSSSGPGELLFDGNGNRLGQPQVLDKVDVTGVDGTYTSVSGFQPFYGTSAATPNAGAVAALMLQADRYLTSAQIEALLERSALPFGQAETTGAGLVQAPGAVQASIIAATTPIWTGQGGTTSWSLAANWSDQRVPGSTDTAVLTDGDGQLSGAYAVIYDVANSTIAGLTIDGGTTGGNTTAPALTIAAGDSLTVSGTATLAHHALLTVTGSFAAAQLTVDATSLLDFDQAGNAAFAGGISGTGGLVQSGSGVLTLSGNDTYSGATKVSNGTLLVDGTDLSSTFDVQGGATLGGRGSLGTVTVEAGGLFSPGDGSGLITVASLTLAGSASFVEQIGGATVGNGDGHYDQTIVTKGGSVALGGATLNLSLLGSFQASTGQVFTLIDNETGIAVSGNFVDAGGKTLAEGSQVTVGGQTFAISYMGADATDGGHNSVTLTFIPANVAPTASVPSGGYHTVGSTPVGLSGAGLSVADADAQGGQEVAILTVSEGALTGSAGGTGATLNATGGTTLTITGTLDQINAVLHGSSGASLSFADAGTHPAASVPLSLSINDQGHTGTGGALTGSAATTISVTVPNQSVTITNSGGTTSQAAQTITGSALAPGFGAMYTAGTGVEIDDNGAKIGAGTVQADGSFAVAVTLPVQGGNSLTAVETDTTGHTATSAAVTYTLDTAVPGAPTGLADAAIMAGFVNGAGDTASQTLTGTAAAGSLVTVYDGQTKLGTTSADATSGAFSYTLGHLADGSHSLTATATDTAGNTGQASAALAFVVDTVAPSLTVSAVSGQTNHETGHALFGTIGAADAGAVIIIRDGATVLGTTAADSSGHFSFAFSDAKDGPTHSDSFTATATDAAGNTGASDTFVFSFDYTPNQSLFGTLTHDPMSHVGQVYALYEGLLDRAPDQAGAQDWVSQLDHGASLAQVTQGFLDSVEERSHITATGNSNAAYVEQLYETVLHRQGDASGAQGWVDFLDRGASRVDVADAFVFSQEHENQLQPAYGAGVYLADPTDAAVARLYYGLLDRAPDAGGLQSWEGAVHSGASLGSIAQDFLNSAEYGLDHPTTQTDKQYVDGLYQDALGRAAEPTGEQGWLSALASGTSRADVAVGIAESQEAQQHLAGHIEQGWHLA